MQVFKLNLETMLLHTKSAAVSKMVWNTETKPNDAVKKTKVLGLTFMSQLQARTSSLSQLNTLHRHKFTLKYKISLKTARWGLANKCQVSPSMFW